MATEGERYKNVEKIVLTCSLENLQNFKEFCSEIFYVRGNPWTVKFIKKINNNQSFLSVFLNTKLEKILGNGAVMGDFSAEIISRKFDGKSHTGNVPPHAYVSDYGWGCSVINWNALIDPENGFLYNDKCKIVVNVRASPLQIDDQLLKITPIAKCCDGTSRGEFRIKVNEVGDFVNVCTPELTLKNFLWRILVCKIHEAKDGKNEDFLQIKLLNATLANDKTGKSCTATMICKLISCDLNAEPLHLKFEKQEFKFGSSEQHLNILPWNELMNPEMKFVQNESFKLEIVIEVEEKKEQEAERALKRTANNKNNQGFIRLECPICFNWLIDQPISLLSCGHMYCSACIAESLKERKICPLCLKESTETELRKVHFPAK